MPKIYLLSYVLSSIEPSIHFHVVYMINKKIVYRHVAHWTTCITQATSTNGLMALWLLEGPVLWLQVGALSSYVPHKLHPAEITCHCSFWQCLIPSLQGKNGQPSEECCGQTVQKCESECLFCIITNALELALIYSGILSLPGTRGKGFLMLNL